MTVCLFAPFASPSWRAHLAWELANPAARWLLGGVFGRFLAFIALNCAFGGARDRPYPGIIVRLTGLTEVFSSLGSCYLNFVSRYRVTIPRGRADGRRPPAGCFRICADSAIACCAVVLLFSLRADSVSEVRRAFMNP
jgi:hypothetical protein